MTEKNNEYPATLELAMLSCQLELTNPIKGTDNPFFKSKYATLPEIRNLVTPILAKQGLYVTQVIDYMEGIALSTTIVHAPTKERFTSVMPLMVEKQTPQGQGSAITYARRYALCAMLNIAADEDDDGNAASQNKAKKDDNVRGGTTASELAEDWPLEARKSTVKEVLTRLNGLTKEKEKEAKAYTNKIIKNLKFVGSNDLALELEVALEHAVNALNPEFEDDGIGF